MLSFADHYKTRSLYLVPKLFMHCVSLRSSKDHLMFGPLWVGVSME